MTDSSRSTLLVIFWMFDSIEATRRSNKISTRKEYTIAASVPIMTASITSANSNAGMIYTSLTLSRDLRIILLGIYKRFQKRKRSRDKTLEGEGTKDIKLYKIKRKIPRDGRL